jgi:hypothetical protein
MVEFAKLASIELYNILIDWSIIYAKNKLRGCIAYESLIKKYFTEEIPGSHGSRYLKTCNRSCFPTRFLSLHDKQIT